MKPICGRACPKASNASPTTRCACAAVNPLAMTLPFRATRNSDLEFSGTSRSTRLNRRELCAFNHDCRRRLVALAMLKALAASSKRAPLHMAARSGKFSGHQVTCSPLGVTSTAPEDRAGMTVAASRGDRALSLSGVEGQTFGGSAGAAACCCCCVNAWARSRAE